MTSCCRPPRRPRRLLRGAEADPAALAPGWIVKEYKSASDLGTSTIAYQAGPTQKYQANITLAAGDTVRCNYVNVKTGRVIVIKKTIGGGNNTFSFTSNLPVGNFDIDTRWEVLARTAQSTPVPCRRAPMR